ncbi:MAG: RCC1 domain-containing protein [Actinomycetota bacterium]
MRPGPNLARLAPLAVAVLLVGCGGAVPSGADDANPTTPTPSTARVSAGGYHTCAIAEDGRASCWGLGDSGQLGDGATASSATPVAVAAPDGVTFIEVASGNAHTCAIADDGSVWCWGVDLDGGDEADRNAVHGPERVALPDGMRVLSLDGTYHDCAATQDGGAWCWGRGTEGQLGDGAASDAVAPVAVATPDGVAFARIVAGGFHTCALDAEGAAWCWGQDLHGQLGDGATAADRAVPGRVAAPETVRFVALSAGFNHTCALDADGAAWCWGEGTSGQLGDGATDDASAPVAVAMPGGVRFAAIDAGNAHTCALATGGSVWCWGLGIQGVATAFGVSFSPSAFAVGPGEAVVAVGAGGFHSCALLADASVWCWGDDALGQLGDGTAGGTSEPVRIVDLAA